MRGEDDYAIFFAGVAHDVVAHGLGAGGRIGGELVGLEVTPGGFELEVVLDKVFGGEVAGGAVVALGGDGEELLGKGCRWLGP